MTTPKTFSVTVRDRNGIVFDGEVRALSAYNAKGLFDILPVHSNFISVLRQKLILHKVDGSKQEMNLESGVVRALLNKVVVYVGLK